MIKLKDLISENGGFLSALMGDFNKNVSAKNKFFIDPKDAKIGDAVEWYGEDKDPRATGTIVKIDSKGIAITNLKGVGTTKWEYGMKGRTLNANTKYYFFGPNKMLNHWKLKDTLDMDSNNNGYPDGTEATLMSKKINWKSLEFEDIDPKDYPEFVDAYVSYAEYEDGSALTDDELEKLDTDYPKEVRNALENYLH